MLVIRILILLVLCSIFIQDISSRSVYWIVFPVLAVLFIALKLVHQLHTAEFWQPIVINILFLGVQLLIVSVWFSLRRGHWVDITAKMIGWGDVLFLATISCYLSVLNFLFFYIGSLIITLILWLVIQLFSSRDNKHIPLAGLQALMFVFFLCGDWYITHINVTDDYWLQKMLIR